MIFSGKHSSLYKILRFNYIIVLFAVLMLILTGCSKFIEREGTNSESAEETAENETAEISSLYSDIYNKASKEGTLGSLDTVSSIVKSLGEGGYIAVDSKNQVNMTNYEQAEQFCESVSKKESAEISIFRINYTGGFVKYDLTASEGKVDVVRSYYEFNNGELQNKTVSSYKAVGWKYTEEGCIFFSGTWHSDELYTVSLSEADETAALRVLPLDEKCREFNREYILPIGYENNNMFIVNWNENNYTDLDFSDIFNICSRLIYGKALPAYMSEDDLTEGTVYEIPSEEFEKAVMTYFNIESEELQSQAKYLSESSAYEYKPRGYYERETTQQPYPEVTDCVENSNGTITLSVNAVFPYEKNSKLFSHKVTVKPLDGGGVQYISNRITSEEDFDTSWHMPRLTDDEWNEIYGGSEDAGSEGSEGNSLLSNEERKQLNGTILQAAEQTAEIYQDVEFSDDAVSYASNIVGFTFDQRKAVVSALGSAGFTSVTDGYNMENPDALEAFYSDWLNGIDSVVSVYEVNSDGLIGVKTLVYRNDRLQCHYISIGWQEGGTPELKDSSIRNISEINLTEKGYFIYAYEQPYTNSSLREYWRITPVSDEYRELTEKYVSGLSYVNYDMLITDWNSDNADDIIEPCMFDDIYRIYAGESYTPEDNSIPSDLFEEVMTAYFPVSAEALRNACKYDEESETYPYESTSGKAYDPFGEVVDYEENSDGTITLTVDEVWIEYNSDCAFTNRLTVESFDDGTFKYISNSIVQ